MTRRGTGSQDPPIPPGNPVGVDTLNKFRVGIASDGTIAVLNPPLQARRLVPGANLTDTMPEWPAIAPLTVAEALNLAAWIVAVTGRRFEFNSALDEIALLCLPPTRGPA